ncbi:amidohydrolase family protein [Pseudoponticoccus marisrubri]|uniref:Amidohydrolase n=1 Tax=Pseudoponticoccus marisrubri TaxID=1685382 RepID=A0A0W7WH07_9RHOB|nr:amidohydrolase family protein [Pseudoponticoccus marisrubri]KUF09900.1 amidohydrolase [Pseudoponticoccus marisrubri]
MHIVDTHLHLVYPDRFAYPWIEEVPPLQGAWTAEAYFDRAVPLGISAALHMEVDVAEAQIAEESRFMAGVHPRIAGVIAACRPERADFAEQLDRLSDLAALRGLRRVLHVVPDDVSQSETFRANIAALAARGLSFDLCVRADQLPLAIALADAAPDTVMVLDHCGVPTMQPEDFDRWAGDVADLARRGNVMGKISGVIAYGGEGPPEQRLRPYVEHMVACFGWDRLVWGSDHPVCTLGAPLEDWVATTHRLLEGCSEAEVAALLHRNAQRIYRLGEIES